MPAFLHYLVRDFRWHIASHNVDRELRPHRDVLGRLNPSSNMECAFARSVAVDVLEGGIHREEKKVVSGSWDQTVRIWDAVTGECEQTLQGHSDWVSSASFSPDGTKVVSGSEDQTVRIWDAVRSVRLF